MSDNELRGQLDRQDSMLREILSNMERHKTEHEAVDPSIIELVDILKGIKFLKATAIVTASIAGFLLAAWVWARDHIRL